ncbi:hypothetical protein [Arthrobacter sp. OY3WO11]|uniref:hypothetical protein n=1 Tax=Arthrobacter sp. OY3WO11 TaxID=1835723 RepID=UPI0007CF06BD|nr:hypothetical protein [Arthrobacter sp. OY3WO11]OAD97704.1 hypothetical protein A6A22_20060 [Arthrobacter sp. OY3WO11]
MGDIVDKHVLDRRRIVRDFWLRITIPAVLFAGLLVFLFTSVSLDALPPALLITGAALLIGGAIGFLTGIRGPHWPIYALIFTGLAVLFLLPHPWRGLAFVPIPTSAAGYAMGKEVAFFRLNLRQPVLPTTN